MRIGVLGTGVVGQTLSAALARLGHDVAIGTRDVEAALARSEGPRPGMPSFAGWHGEHASVRVATWLYEWFGWRGVLDLGDITTARGAEMYVALWIRLLTATGSPMFNVKVVL